MKHAILIRDAKSGNMIELEFNTEEACKELFDELSREESGFNKMLTLWMYEKGEEDHTRAFVGKGGE